MPTRTALLSILLSLLAAAPATQPTTQPITPNADGSILLHSRDATIHGKTVRYEPKPEKNTIGYWTNKDDYVSWDFEVKQPASFHLLPLQGCGKGSGGAEVEFILAPKDKPEDARTLTMTVQDTGGFQKFVERDLGSVDLKPGSYTLTVKPKSKPGVAVMDLRQVILKPPSK